MMNLSNTNSCLILTVDGQDCYNNTKQGFGRDYEHESIRCIRSWRKNGGWLKDIPIYIHSPANPIKQETIDVYNTVDGVVYVDEKLIMKEFQYGFFNVHYSGRYMEQTLPEELVYLIHIDLDMELLREIPPSVFENDYWVLLGGYNPEDYQYQRTPLYEKHGEPIITNTGFIVSNRGFKFYEKLVDLMENFDTSTITREYDMEEYCADIIISENDDVGELVGYEQGEGYAIITDFDRCYFWHEHSSSKLDVRLKIHRQKIVSWISKTITIS